ncbi:hypothetical protein BJV78DRAFT_829069 [Lactifluus subvellereus]|nr:hypothetical protein BJV78DRAFT_829069 [Lactifluus subvellereus]
MTRQISGHCHWCLALVLMPACRHLRMIRSRSCTSLAPESTYLLHSMGFPPSGFTDSGCCQMMSIVVAGEADGDRSGNMWCDQYVDGCTQSSYTTRDARGILALRIRSRRYVPLIKLATVPAGEEGDRLHLRRKLRRY